VITCGQCARENPHDARFCNGCGAPLAAETRVREERKLVTAVFVDLVGSTARAEQLDPEDVRALLRRYHDTLRRELERYGGTVEKFIGVPWSPSTALRWHTGTTPSEPCGPRLPSAMRSPL
jgi:hypothetical protein